MVKRRTLYKKGKHTGFGKPVEWDTKFYNRVTHK